MIQCSNAQNNALYSTTLHFYARFFMNQIPEHNVFVIRAKLEIY